MQEEHYTEAISDSDFGTINEDLPTRFMIDSHTTPDVTIVSANLIPTCNWRINQALSSDHSNIVLMLGSEIKRLKSEKRTFVNFNKADWKMFQRLTEEAFNTEPITDNVYTSEKIFRDIVNKAANQSIPKGHIPNIIHEVPTDAAC